MKSEVHGRKDRTLQRISATAAANTTHAISMLRVCTHSRLPVPNTSAPKYPNTTFFLSVTTVGFSRSGSHHITGNGS